MTARVFILERTDTRKRQINVQDAKAYGDIVYMFDGISDRPSIWSEDFAEAIRDKLDERKFDPATDYFAVAGYFVPVTIAISVLITDYGSVKVLFYSATEQDYVPKVLGDAEEITIPR